jgi:hypothetical protein
MLFSSVKAAEASFLKKFEVASRVFEEKKFKIMLRGSGVVLDFSFHCEKRGLRRRKASSKSGSHFPNFRNDLSDNRSDNCEVETEQKSLENRRLNCALRAIVRRCLWFKQTQSIWLA